MVIFEIKFHRLKLTLTFYKCCQVKTGRETDISVYALKWGHLFCFWLTVRSGLY